MPTLYELLTQAVPPVRRRVQALTEHMTTPTLDAPAHPYRAMASGFAAGALEGAADALASPLGIAALAVPVARALLFGRAAAAAPVAGRGVASMRALAQAADDLAASTGRWPGIPSQYIGRAPANVDQELQRALQALSDLTPKVPR